MSFESFYKEFSQFAQVEAIALGGSRAGKNFDKNSDYDLYVYCTEIPEYGERKAVLDKYCRYKEMGNGFWEYEDDCTLQSGVDIDIVYRNLNCFEREISSVVEEFKARNGYTTCMWHNLLNCKILYDRRGAFKAMQNRFNVPYPKQLQKNIIENNFRLLTGNLPSYDSQIKKAAARKDWVSINHRVAAFLESYFDIVFALNGLTHPGEKRMVGYALENAEILPDGFEENINCLFSNLFTDTEKAQRVLFKMIYALEKKIHLINYGR